MTQAVTDPFLRGPDVSAWQGDVDWAAVVSSGRRFALAKATEGTDYVSEYFAAHRRGMAEAGLVLRGLYHFARPDRNGAGAEASHFLAVVGELAPGEVPALDIEVGDPAGWEGWAGEWLRIVEQATGRLPLVYMSASPANEHGMASLTRYPLWVAAYPDSHDPSGWGTDWTAGAWDRWTFWQYTSVAQVPGIEGEADDNVFAGTLAELEALAGGRSPTPAPPDPPPQATTGWAEVDRYLLQEGVGINVPAAEWQTTGGTHVATSWHYQGMARDYSAGMGCDENAVVVELRPLAGPDGPIIELFHAATDTWLSHGAYVPWVGGHTDHVHAAIEPGRSLPVHSPSLPQEDDMASDHVLFNHGGGVLVRFSNGQVLTLASNAQVESLLAAGCPSLGDVDDDQYQQLTNHKG